MGIGDLRRTTLSYSVHADMEEDAKRLVHAYGSDLLWRYHYDREFGVLHVGVLSTRRLALALSGRLRHARPCAPYCVGLGGSTPKRTLDLLPTKLRGNAPRRNGRFLPNECGRVRPAHERVWRLRMPRPEISALIRHKTARDANQSAALPRFD